MKLREYLNGVNFWSEINNVQQFAFISDPSQMDLIQVIEYGDRTLFAGFENTPPQDVAKLIVTHFAEKWNALINARIDEIDVTSLNTSKSKTTSTITGNKTDIENTENKISGYNTSELITDNGNDSTKTEDTSRESAIEKIDSIASYEYLFDNLSTVEKSNIITLAIEDATKYLTISIY